MATNTAERTAKAAANSTTAERLARTGLAARGAVFLILAYLVVRIAFGALGSSSTAHSASGPGVAQAISAQPGGRLMLILLGAGLLFFALFSTIDALMHHDDERSDVKRWGKRFVAVATAVLYACFAVYCVVAAAGDVGHQSAQQSDAEQAQWSAKVLNWPLGQFWLGLLGVVLMVIAVVVTVLACVPHFADRLERHRMSRRMWRFAIITGTAGYLGRAALFGTVGWFVMSAAIENDPQHGQGVDGAVRLLADNGAGGIFLVVVAAALACFGLYLFVEARYRKV